MVASALLYGESERHFHQLRAWVIMPNHVHVVLRPNASLARITRWLKGSAARPGLAARQKRLPRHGCYLLPNVETPATS